MRPTLFMSPIFAMPTTTVAKMIGAIIIRISLMNPSPSGLSAAPVARPEVADRDAQHDAHQHLEVQVRVDRRAFGTLCRGHSHLEVRNIGK